MSTAPSFPGNTSVSRLSVYDWPTSDGLRGGSPHLHTASSEGYVVLDGQGRVQTISSDGFREHDLCAGAVVWFSPGTVHRLINDGGLDILVVMGNAGLPEAGDAVFTFPVDVLADAGAYAAAAAVPAHLARAEQEAAVRARRDLALEGFATLRARTEAEGTGALHELHKAAAELVRSHAVRWESIVAEGAKASAERTLSDVQHLVRGDGSVLRSAAVDSTRPATAERAFGMCGYLQKWNVSNF